MTVKRVILAILTAMALILVGFSLLDSWNQPQIQSRLELYQTNLVLHAAQWQPNPADDSNLAAARDTLVGKEAFNNGLKQYQEAKKSAIANREKLQQRQVADGDTTQLNVVLETMNRLIDELEVRIGILQVQTNQREAGLATWQGLIARGNNNPAPTPSLEIAQVLQGIWSNPAQLLPDAEPKIQKHLDGWFRYRALTQLYQFQERQDDLNQLVATEQRIAEQAMQKLAIVAGVPGLGFLLGIAILVFLAVQLLLQGKRSLLALDSLPSVPWNGETILQVMVVGFFLVGQILVPLGLSLFKQVANLNPAAFDARTQALYILATYILLAAGGLIVLALSIRPFSPLPEGWFRSNLSGKWLLWGIGGYLAALPIVVVVSLINQQLWDGQGGSNPILPIALENRDRVALAIFFLTASLAAPIFEEIMFRGFLLPSLTRYLPVWGAVPVSGLIFAAAHLNISEVLPLTALGTVLGFVYARSGNLLSSMLLHSLWNSGTLLTLFVLGSGVT